MLLREFFSHNTAPDKEEETSEELAKDIMAFILDDDDVYKKLMMPIIDEIKKEHKNKTYDKKNAYKKYEDLVDRCCMGFYDKEKMEGDPNEHFPHPLRVKLCKQLAQINQESFKEHEAD